MGNTRRRVLVVCASPRRDGNSWTLAEELALGASERGHQAHVADLTTVMRGMLQDCRVCRGPDGSCRIDDEFGTFVHSQLVPADALVYATPLYWYGMAATLKNFFDRLVCYISASYPRRTEVVEGLRDKRSALLLASEEANAAAGMSVIAQLTEISRYLHHEFVAVINGIGNKRGEVRFDPTDPLGRARRLGQTIFDIHHSDYHLDAERPNAVWAAARESVDDATVNPYADV